LFAGGRRSSSGERPRGSSDAESVSVRGGRGLCRGRGPPWVSPRKGTAALFALCLDALLPPVIARSLASTKSCQHEVLPARSLAKKKPRPTHTSDLLDPQREKPLIPPQRSSGDGRLPDLRDALQAMFYMTQNDCFLRDLKRLHRGQRRKEQTEAQRYAFGGQHGQPTRENDRNGRRSMRRVSASNCKTSWTPPRSRTSPRPCQKGSQDPRNRSV